MNQLPITVSAPGYETQTVFLYPVGTQRAGADSASGSIDGGPMLRNGQPNFTPNMAAGSAYTMSLIVGEDENGVAAFDFGAAGSLGGSNKTVTLEKDGVVIAVGAGNAGNATVGLNNPAAPNNLTPGEWKVIVLFADPGAAVLTINP